MKFSKTHLLNKLLLASAKLSHHRYYSSLNRVSTKQQQKLLKYIFNNRTTAYGTDFNFKNICDYTSFAAAVPVIDNWTQLQSYINRIENGEQNVLSVDQVDAFEETSGTTGLCKLIPYNGAVRKEFEVAVQVWMLDLYATFPQSFYGKAYWSVSPVLKEKRNTKGGVPIGIEDDSEYFNSFVGYLLSKIMAVSKNLIKVKDSYAFYFGTLKQLLLQTDLSFISVWSPTYFLQLDEFLRNNLEVLLQEVETQNKRRAEEIRKVTADSYNWKHLWPNLSCISCWTNAQAAVWMGRVRTAAGDVAIQPKGLLSTEAVVTIPIKNASFPALAYQSHFFEFRNIEDNNIYLAHNLAVQAWYEVIVTTAGGLYRYATKDIVQVKGYCKQVPLLLFLGRLNRTSDLVGEKVSEMQVNEIMTEVLRQFEDIAPVLFLKPQQLEQSAMYILFIEENPDINEQQAEKITRTFESALAHNPYYKQALNTGQLKGMQYKLIKKGFSKDLKEYYSKKKLIKEGDMKIPALFLLHELNDLITLCEQLSD